jgi:hypothetical protein
MPDLIAILTEATCGEACWTAREDICRCSCGGKNHGCLRTADGIQPIRTAKIDGFRYELKAVGIDVYVEAAAINHAAGKKHVVIGTWEHDYPWEINDKGAPARVKKATKSQLMGWPELASHKAEIAAIEARPHAPIEIYDAWPMLLWVKI